MTHIRMWEGMEGFIDKDWPGWGTGGVESATGMELVLEPFEPRSDWEWSLADMTVRPGKSARIPNRVQRWFLKTFMDIRWRRAA